MKKNIVWNTLGSIFYSVCQWLISILIVHIDSLEAAGCLSLAMTYSSSFSAIALFSMRNFQVSDIKGEYRTNSYVGSRIITSIVAFICCAIIAFWGNSVYQGTCIVAFMLIRIAEAIVDVLHGINQKYNRYDYIGKSYILRGIATILSFMIGMRVTKSLLFSLELMAILNLGIVFFFDWRKTDKLEKFRPEIRQKQVWSLLKKCAPLVVFSFLLSLNNLFPKTILQQKYGDAELGIYSSIASPTLVVQVFASVVFQPFLPKFSTLYFNGKIKEFRKMLHSLYFAFLIMGVMVLFGAKIFGKLGLQILLGEWVLAYYNLFLPIVLCTSFTGVIWILSSVLVGMRKIAWISIGMVVDFALCVIVTEPFLNYYEKNGVSLVQIFVLSLYIIFMILLCEIDSYKKLKCV